MATLLTLHGPNLNLLGQREPEHYGQVTLADIDSHLTSLAHANEHEIQHLQSNSETVLVERIQQAATENIDFILINPAAFTHTSVAIRDALAAADIPFIEIHLSNVHAREPFRQRSFVSDIAVGVITGFGQYSYYFAFEAAINYLKNLKS
ncbi:MAG: type II 3-dehydroquinate dehydratase [Acidiferrobacteraceae bacterium]|nr:type II 3-dehydroquinate dehydratase [Acidiferrobacteraceae bacterium]